MSSVIGLLDVMGVGEVLCEWLPVWRWVYIFPYIQSKTILSMLHLRQPFFCQHVFFFRSNDVLLFPQPLQCISIMFVYILKQIMLSFSALQFPGDQRTRKCLCI